MGEYFAQLASIFKNWRGSPNGASQDEEPKEALEIELRLLIDARRPKPKFVPPYPGSGSVVHTVDLAKRLIKSFPSSSKSIHQSINLIEQEFIKQIVFKDGVQQKDKKLLYQKKRLAEAYLVHPSLSCKLSVASEKPTKYDPQVPSLARGRLRISIEDPQLGDWRLDITLVRNALVETAALQSVRDLLFRSADLSVENFEEAAPWPAAETIEFELEYIGQEFNLGDLDVLASLEDLLGANKGYLQTVSNLIGGPRFKRDQELSIKSLTPQVHELTKRVYSKMNLEDYSLTDKADGLRQLVLLKGNTLEAEATSLKLNINYPKPSVLDTELIDGIFWAFDAPFILGKDISTEPLNQRLEQLANLELPPEIKLKKFRKLTEPKDVASAYEEAQKGPYQIDGMIFTPNLEGYWNTSFKWKPPEQLTIDFLVKMCPANKLGIEPYIPRPKHFLYILQVGVSQKAYSKRKCLGDGQPKRHRHNRLNPKIESDSGYLDVPFEPIDCPYAHLYWSKDPSLDSKVFEFALAHPSQSEPSDEQNSDGPRLWTGPEWTLHRERPDKQHGNHIRVAESIWESHKSPLTLDVFTNGAPLGGYFQQESQSQTKAERNFVRFVISQAFKQLKNSKWIMDLASGNGQDLFRYPSLTQNVLFVERDKDAIVELLNRFHDYEHNDRLSCTRVHVLEANLLDPWEGTLRSIQTKGYGVPPRIDAVVCNLALHYFAQNEGTLDNILALMTALKPSKIIYTAFDGQAVFDVLKNESKFVRGPFAIEKAYKSSSFTGNEQAIRVKLPFNQELQKEWLIDHKTVKSKMARLGYRCTMHESFESWFDHCSRDNPQLFQSLTPLDKDYVKLYHLTVFERKAHL